MSTVFDIVAYSVFRLNVSFDEQFPVFALRIKLISESLICSQDMSKHNKKVLVLQTNGSNVEFYLPPNHPHDQITWNIAHKIQYYRAYNGGACRLLLIGRKCSPSVSHNQIIRIHYYPSKSLLLPHEIDISMKKTLNCSSYCSLNVGILESIERNNTQMFRYHEWKQIYRLTWQVIAAESRCFSITINSTCTACIKLCDVAVAMGLPLKSNLATVTSIDSFGMEMISTNNTDFFMDILTEYFCIQRKICKCTDDMLRYGNFQRIMSKITSPVEGIMSQHATYGNWNDANAYCLARKRFSLYTDPILVWSTKENNRLKGPGTWLEISKGTLFHRSSSIQFGMFLVSVLLL